MRRCTSPRGHGKFLMQWACVPPNTPTSESGRLDGERPAVIGIGATMGSRRRAQRFPLRVCAYCGAALDETNRTVDHVIPRALFSRTKRDNMIKVPACRPCNGEKS